MANPPAAAAPPVNWGATINNPADWDLLFDAAERDKRNKAQNMPLSLPKAAPSSLKAAQPKAAPSEPKAAPSEPKAAPPPPEPKAAVAPALPPLPPLVAVAIDPKVMDARKRHFATLITINGTIKAYPLMSLLTDVEAATTAILDAIEKADVAAKEYDDVLVATLSRIKAEALRKVQQEKAAIEAAMEAETEEDRARKHMSLMRSQALAAALAKTKEEEDEILSGNNARAARVPCAAPAVIVPPDAAPPDAAPLAAAPLAAARPAVRSADKYPNNIGRMLIQAAERRAVQ